MKQKIYSSDEAHQAILDCFGGDELAAKIWMTEYAPEDSCGNIYEQTPRDMHQRIARELVRIGHNYPNPLPESELMDLMDHLRYIVPQGSPMTGTSNNYQITSLSNCFVIGLDGEPDSHGDTIHIDEEQIRLMRHRGGVGHDLSHMRPKDPPVKNSALTSTGLVPFMERYSNSTREVAQDGRCGTLMLAVSINHPDSESFIDAKTTEGKVTGASVSVRINDAFVQAIVGDKEYLQTYPVHSAEPKFTRTIQACQPWDKIVYNAWRSVEPGVLFWDTITHESMPDCYANLGLKTISTNPCGEIPLCPYDNCRLLAINLCSYVRNPFTAEASFDFNLLREHVVKALHIMDDIIGLEAEKIDAILVKIASDTETEEIKAAERELWRKIKREALLGRHTSVGITAEGDMLTAMGMRYGSDETISFAEEAQKTLCLSAYAGSIELAKGRGTFDLYDTEREKDSPFIQRIAKANPELYEEMKKFGRRNIATLTIAPTGSTSLMTQTSSGIEPVFMSAYKRRRRVSPNDKNVKVDYTDETGDTFEEYTVYHHNFLTWMKINNCDPERDYSHEGLQELVAKSPYHKATANDVDWVTKVKMRGRIQQWVDHDISVTINLPSGISQGMVATLYVEAWKVGCKDCAICREGSRSGVLISEEQQKKGKQAKTEQEAAAEIPIESTTMPQTAHKRPKVLDADVVRFQNNKEKRIAFVGLLDGRPYEVFTGIADNDEGITLPKSVMRGKIIRSYDKDGTKHYDFQFHNKRGFKIMVEGLDTKFNPEYWNHAKLISDVLRYQVPIDQVINLVQGMELNDESINTWENDVARALRSYLPSGTAVTAACSNCRQHTLVYQEGCLICTNCGSSKCG